MSEPPKPPKLTLKQTAFRDAILAGFQPSQAYRKAFDAKGMSKKAISVNAAKLLKHKKVALAIALAVNEGKQPTVLPALPPSVQLTMQRRLDELQCAATLDPIDCFDELNHFKSIREMPEHVRRAIAGFEVDPVSFITKVKFMDKRAAIDTYSKLAGDIPVQKQAPGPTGPAQAERFDLRRLTPEQFEQYTALREAAKVPDAIPVEGHATGS